MSKRIRSLLGGVVCLYSLEGVLRQRVASGQCRGVLVDKAPLIASMYGADRTVGVREWLSQVGIASF